MILLNHNTLVDPTKVSLARKEMHTSDHHEFGYGSAHYSFTMKMLDGEEIRVFYNGGTTEDLQRAAEELRDSEFELLHEASNS